MIRLFGLSLLCCISGCASMAKFTPEQVQSIRDTSQALVDAVHDSGASGVAIIHLGPVRAELTEGIALSGIEATVVIQANPASMPREVEPKDIPNESTP